MTPSRACALITVLFLAFGTSACEMSGDNVKEDNVIAYPSAIEVKVYNDKFHVNQKDPTKKIEIAAGGTVTFRTPSKAPAVNIVISQLGIDVPVAPGQTYQQSFPSAGNFQAQDMNSGSRPTLNIVVHNAPPPAAVEESSCSVLSLRYGSSLPAGLAIFGFAGIAWVWRRRLQVQQEE